MIKVAKLVNGEFAIGQIVDNLFTNVASIKFVADPISGGITKQIVPIMHPISNNVGKVISHDKIIMIEDAGKELQVLYLTFIKNLLENIQRINDERNKSGITGGTGKAGETGATGNTDPTETGPSIDGPDAIHRDDPGKTKES